ncbi:MAG: hypothetical protein IT168_17520 [Bryobacterales bacterium]|nr:hypothetical protein [Bryobacterales bacterium]
MFRLRVDEESHKQNWRVETFSSAGALFVAMMPHHHSAPSHEQAGTHNMFVIGSKAVYLSHLPMFHGEHAAQVILEVNLQQSDKSLNATYFEDRSRHQDTKIYTLQPREEFVLSELFTPSVSAPARKTFAAEALFRGHLERPGNAAIAKAFSVSVSRVVHAHRLPAAQRPGQLTYILFGTPEDSFAAHFITQPPDFDQLLGVKLIPPASDQELAHGLTITIGNRSNSAATRIKAGERLAGRLQSEAGTARDVELVAETEFYFEEGELLAEPTFRSTPLERESGF